MESQLDNALKQEKIYDFLESVIEPYGQTCDSKSISMKEYFIKLHRIIYKYNSHSDESIVNDIEYFFEIMIKNMLRTKLDSILFKVLSYFIKIGFNLFVDAMKGAKVTTKIELNEKLLDILDSPKIEKHFSLCAGQVETVLNIDEFKKTLQKMKSKKLMYFVLFFFRKFIDEKDEFIMNDIKKNMDEKKIDKFYKRYDQEIILNTKQEETNASEITDKNEFKGDILDDNELKQETNNLIIKVNDIYDKGSPEITNIDKNDSIKNSNNNSNNKEINPDNNDDISTKINKLFQEIHDLKEKDEQKSKEIQDLKAKEEQSKKTIQTNVGKITILEKTVKELKDGIEILNDKLSLSLLINSLSAQRDTYKKSLEVLSYRMN